LQSALIGDNRETFHCVQGDIFYIQSGISLIFSFSTIKNGKKTGGADAPPEIFVALCNPISD